MRLSIKTKQVIGVTSIVGLVVVALSLIHLATLARVRLEESRARGQLLSNAIFHRAREAVLAGRNPSESLRQDEGLRSILESSVYSTDVMYAAIVDVSGRVVAHSDPGREGQTQPARPDVVALLQRSSLAQLAAIYSDEGRTLELGQPLFIDASQFGSIRIGVSTLLIRTELDRALSPALVTAIGSLVIASLVAMLLAQLILRPIHVIRSGLTRLGQGEFGVRLDLPQQDEFGELGSFFNALSAQLSADRTNLAGQKAKLESVVDHLTDAVAIFNPDGALLFANQAIRASIAEQPEGQSVAALLPAAHPYRRAVEQSLASRESSGPVSMQVPVAGAGDSDQTTTERLVTTSVLHDAHGHLVGVVLIARNVGYLGQVESTINYSRKLVALGRLSAGVAHEVKNPLNAMMIHLELLKSKLARPAMPARSMAAPGGGRPAGLAEADGTAPIDPSAALEHVKVITDEIRRLDEVVQGFLKFSRPADLKLQPVALDELVDEVQQVVASEAEGRNITVRIECAPALAAINGDPTMLRQAFLNLALNACQAMPSGGTLRITCGPTRDNRVEVRVEDTGVGIEPQHLERIFDLYFTTKSKGSGIGLSMVYRIVQLHDGEIEVQSTPGRGTAFRLLFPVA